MHTFKFDLSHIHRIGAKADNLIMDYLLKTRGIKYLKTIGHLITFFSIFCCFNTEALVPMQSLIYGDLSNQYEQKNDSLSYIFNERKRGFNEKLQYYLAFNEEANNLKNYCDNKVEINYIDNWNETQVKRTVLSTLQYIGIDITARALAQYANYFEFNEGEFNNFSKSLIGNYCSQNITTISLKELQNNMENYYSLKNQFLLPTIKDDQNFPIAMNKGFLNKGENSIAQEFQTTIDLFKSFCSWGNDTVNLRLLVPLVRDPAVMSFIHRQLAGKKIAIIDKKASLVNDNKSTVVICDDLICRKSKTEKLKEKLKLSLGGQSYLNDFERMYCNYFKMSDYQYRDQVPKIKKIIKSITLDEQNLLVNQFIALITGVPDFIVRSEKYSSLKRALKASFDRSLNHWANEQVSRYEKDLLFEERLKIKLVDRKYYFSERIPKFKVNFDITFGEFDNAFTLNDKIKAHFNIKISKKFLIWARRLWKEVDSNDEEEMAKILRPFQEIIKGQLTNVKNSFETAPWSGEGLDRLIAFEVLEQLSHYRGTYFEEDKGMVEFPVIFNYGVFAVRYIGKKWAIGQEEGKRAERIGQLQEILPGR